MRVIRSTRKQEYRVETKHIDKLVIRGKDLISLLGTISNTGDLDLIFNKHTHRDFVYNKETDELEIKMWKSTQEIIDTYPGGSAHMDKRLTEER